VSVGDAYVASSQYIERCIFQCLEIRSLVYRVGKTAATTTMTLITGDEWIGNLHRYSLDWEHRFCHGCRTGMESVAYCKGVNKVTVGSPSFSFTWIGVLLLRAERAIIGAESPEQTSTKRHAL